MGDRRSLLSRVSPAMLIVLTVVFIAAVPFLNRMEEFCAAAVLLVVSSLFGRTGLPFWSRYMKLSLPIIVLSVFFNWILYLPHGFKSLVDPALFVSSQNLDVLWKALIVGGRLALALFFSFLLVHICTHDELVWGLARISDKIFHKPVVGEILALSLLSVPFFLDSLSRVKRWADVPRSVARVFDESRSITTHPVQITGKRPGFVLFPISVALLVVAVVYR